MIDGLLKSKIDSYVDELIRKAEELVRKTKVYERTQTSQIQNLVNIASSTNSLEAIKLYIQYQTARGLLKAEGDFSTDLINYISNKNYISNNLPSIAKNIAGEDTETFNEVLFKLIQLFFGYLKRVFVCFEKPKKSSKEESGSE
ncbi:MAG: hypothetical protein OdinLCB4_007420 [Candidatus Odinarchaeum yellowstonii]|uniref:Uncharacterized protein n=1 Tax=Odinarchaeota yellowstonii (strain LCB_4) TaxID=1841599 RepID=A0AAF0D228_ODILC|nr:MAG: hypothetical protein OdinLCB4_007420 [Candidatus Odinarchaeum yellowstonii]